LNLVHQLCDRFNKQKLIDTVDDGLILRLQKMKVECRPFLIRPFLIGPFLITPSFFVEITPDREVITPDREERTYFCFINRIAMPRVATPQRGDGGETPKKRARVAKPSRKLDAAQQRKRALMMEQLVKSVALKQTMKIVNEHMTHTLQWKAV
jgi:hypothetical protein